MGISNVSAAAAGTTNTYVTTCITSNTAGCTLESNFCGSFIAYGGCMGLRVPGGSSFDSIGTSGEDFKDIFLASGSTICFSAGSGGLMTGYLF